jgi:hypothetical protein
MLYNIENIFDIAHKSYFYNRIRYRIFSLHSKEAAISLHLFQLLFQNNL